MRVIIYTGKGGVGKTSVSAATARKLAAKGYRTLVMSTDSAHSLSDSMEIEIGGSIKNISKNLDALEIDITKEMDLRWKEIEDYIHLFMSSQGMSEISAKEMAILPGMELIAALFYMLEFEKNNSYDILVMDTAPTAETLRLLSFPDVSRWYLTRLYALSKRLIGLARFTVGRFIDVPLPSKAVMNSIEDISRRMSEVKTILEDPSRTTIRLVVNPERMVINETKRAYSYLCLYGLTVECLIVNRVYPDEVSGYFEDKLIEQKEYMEMIHHAFDPMKMMYSRIMPTEIIGLEKLDIMGEMLFEDSDPSQIYAKESPMRFETAGDVHELIMKIPFAEKGDIELYKVKDDTVVIQVGSHRRNVSLPLTLTKSKLLGAEMRNGELVVKFEKGSQ